MRAMRVCCLSITLLLTLIACASRRAPSRPLPSSAALAAQGVECHKERATGSNVAATVCTTAEQRAREARSVQQTKDWMENVKAGPCPPNVACHRDVVRGGARCAA